MGTRCCVIALGVNSKKLKISFLSFHINILGFLKNKHTEQLSTSELDKLLYQKNIQIEKNKKNKIEVGR